MKKALIYSLSLALILSLAACGQQEPQQENTPPDPAVISTPPDISTPEPPADPEPEPAASTPVQADPEPEPPATSAPEPVVDTPPETPAEPEQTTAHPEDLNKDLVITDEEKAEYDKRQKDPDGEHDTENPDFNPQTLETIPEPTEEELKAEEEDAKVRRDKLLEEAMKDFNGIGSTIDPNAPKDKDGNLMDGRV